MNGSLRVAFGMAEATRRLGRRAADWDLGSVSVALKYAILGPDFNRDTGLEPVRFSPGSSSEPDPPAAWRRLLAEILEKALVHPPETQPADLFDPSYFRRIAQLVAEQEQGERSAPELEVFPGRARFERIGEAPRTAICIMFEAPLHFTNEFYPLAVDAYVAGTRSRACPPLIAAHVSWLDASACVRRCLFADLDADRLVETACTPVRPPAFWALALSARTHKAMEETMKTADGRLLNPHRNGAEVLDDKNECARRWREAGVETPKTVLLPGPGELPPTTLAYLAEGLGSRLVIQPNFGTEGRGVAVFDLRRAGDTVRAADHIARLRRQGEDVIVRAYVDGLGYRESADASPVACDLRVMVSFDGTQHRAESGYLQVGTPRSSGIASAGQGGRIVKFSRGALDRLVARPADHAAPSSGTAPAGTGEAPAVVPVRLTSSDWTRITELAESAVSALPPMPLVGVDLRLAFDPAGGVRPAVLDANPRPAGLAHAEYLPSSRLAGEPGVTQHLWALADPTHRRTL